MKRAKPQNMHESTHTHARTHARTHTHKHTHARMRTRMHTVLQDTKYHLLAANGHTMVNDDNDL